MGTSTHILLSPRKLYAIFFVSYGGYMKNFYGALATLKTADFTAHIHKAVYTCGISNRGILCYRTQIFISNM